MKRFELIIIIGALSTLATYGQNAAGSAGGAAPAQSAPPAAAANQGNINSGAAQNNRAFGQGQPNPTIMRRDQVLPGAGTNGLAVATNAFGFNSNRFGINTNGFQTNFLANRATNGLGISPTSNPGLQNRVYSSNNPAAGPYEATNRIGPASSFGTNASGATDTSGNATMTPADRTVMFSVRQAVQTAFSAGIQPSVNYVVNGGVVTLVGMVPTIEEKLAVQSVASGVPGVNRIVNNIQVNNASTLATSNSVAQAGLARGAVTVANQPGLILTNGVPAVTPTSSNSASRIYAPQRSGLPQGLQNRDTLPPGLQNREQLPPGLSNSTNSTPGTTP